MANMSYCSFTNTLQDLIDCRNALSEMPNFEIELRGEELKAARRLLKICRELADDYTDAD